MGESRKDKRVELDRFILFFWGVKKFKVQISWLLEVVQQVPLVEPVSSDEVLVSSIVGWSRFRQMEGVLDSFRPIWSDPSPTVRLHRHEDSLQHDDSDMSYKTGLPDVDNRKKDP